MNSKDILLKLLKYANRQAKEYGVDIDFVKDFYLHYGLGSYNYYVGKGDSTLDSCVIRNDLQLAVGINVPWYKEACSNYIFDIHPFCPEVTMTDEAYDDILKCMLHGCNVRLKIYDFDNVENFYNKKKNHLIKQQNDLFYSDSRKNNYSQYIRDLQKLSAEYNDLDNEMQQKLYPTITLVPDDILNVEQLQIFLDLYE